MLQSDFQKSTKTLPIASSSPPHNTTMLGWSRGMKTFKNIRISVHFGILLQDGNK